ncbi:MAG TPA: hypothetical protein VF476_00955 [Chitinophagaceae bacterium]
MKKILFILIAFSSCKKDSSSPTVSFQVKEAVSGAPVAGATVYLNRCANAGCAFGTVTEFTGTTDDKGICKVPQDKWDKIPVWNDAIRIYKQNYWSEIFLKANSVTVVPAGWVRLRVIKGGSYPAGSILDIKLTPQINLAGTALYVNESSYQFNAAADSTIRFMCFGNQTNKIDWRVISNSTVLNSGTWNQSVPRLDTVSATLNY